MDERFVKELGQWLKIDLNPMNIGRLETKYVPDSRLDVYCPV